MGAGDGTREDSVALRLAADVLPRRPLPLSNAGNAGPPTPYAFGPDTYRTGLNVRLFDVAPNGTKELVTRGTYTLGGGSGLPLGTVDVTIPTLGNLWQAAAGHTLRLEITNLDSPYITPSRVPSTTGIPNVRLELPTR